MHEIGIKTPALTDTPLDMYVTINRKNERCMLRQHGSFIVAVTMENTFYHEGNSIAIIIVGVYLAIASCCMIFLLSKFMKEKYEKEKLLYTSNTDELTRCYNRHAYETDIHALDLNQEWIYLSLDLNGLKHKYQQIHYKPDDMFLHNWPHLSHTWLILVAFIVVLAVLSIICLRNVSKDR